MVKNPPANGGDTGSIPGPRRSYMPGATEPRAISTTTTEPALYSQWATATEALQPRACAPLKRNCQMEKPERHNQEKPPLTANRESPCRTKTRHGQKSTNQQIFKKKKKWGEWFGNFSMDCILDDIMGYYLFFPRDINEHRSHQEFIFRRCPLKYLQVK